MYNQQRTSTEATTRDTVFINRAMQVRSSTLRGAAGQSGFAFASALAFLLLTISLAFAAESGMQGILGSKALDSAVAGPVWRTRLGMNVGLFLLALIALHMAFAGICWILAVLSERTFARARCSRRQWILIWFLGGTTWLLIANAAGFPHSALGAAYHQAVTFPVLGVTMHSLVSALLAGAAGTTLVLAIVRGVIAVRPWHMLAGVAVVGGATGAAAVTTATRAPTSKQPHVILLGIDSLRPDATGPESTPSIHDFLGGAVQFTDTITPLARTFPSWVSILTGRHPHSTGAYMNLIPRDFIQTGVTLPEVLRRHGYRTTYATDETRFSNIDGTFGFDETLSSPAGASDFVLGAFADTPLSNLLVNTRIGELLFPHVHANRAAHVTYDPDAFVRRLARAIRFDQPAFLAIHLTLPHWPYTWATSEASADEGQPPSLEYQAAIRRADKQLADVMSLLRQRGALDNALVIILSDHGQALGEAGDLLSEHIPGNDSPSLDLQRVGHGTSVLSPPQYRVVLGIRAYGSATSLMPAAGSSDMPASLVDLAPTVLDLLGIHSPELFDGESLVPALVPGSRTPQRSADRIRFTESEYNPKGFREDDISASAVAEAAKVYHLDPVTDRIEVRTQMLDQIMSDRQYAALIGSRAMAAAIPVSGKDGGFKLVFIPDLHNGAPAKVPVDHAGGTKADLLRLRQALQDRFGIRFADRESGEFGRMVSSERSTASSMP